MPASAPQPALPSRFRGSALRLSAGGFSAAAFVPGLQAASPEGFLAASLTDAVEAGVVTLLALVVGASLIGVRRLARRVRTEIEEKDIALAKLRESEGKYRSIFDNAIEGIFRAEPDGRFIAANRTLARMYGWPTAEKFMQQVPDIATQLHVERNQRSALIRALQEANVISNFEFEVERADGRSVWLRENVRAVRDERGQLCYLEGMVEDVSDRWWTEQRRRLQFATNRVLAEADTVADARPAILQAICEILEWDLGAVWDVDARAMVLRCVEIWHSPLVDVEKFEAANAATTYAPGRGLAGEVWKSGEPQWIASLDHVSIFPNAAIAVRAGMRSAFGVPIKVSGSVRHVLEFFSPKISLPDPELLQTLSAIGNQLGHLIERKGAENSLRRSEMRKAAILHSALDCIIGFDEHGAIMEFNPAAERTFGCRAAEVLGRHIAEAILPGNASEPCRQLFGLNRDGRVTESSMARRGEIGARRQDGTQFPAEVAVSRIDTGGSPVYAAFLRDITDRNRLEEQLLQSQKMDAVGRLAGGIAHDFNNILTAILGYTDLVLTQIDAKHWMFKHLDEVRKAAELASSLTHQLLAFSRRQPLFPRIFSLNDIVRDMHKMLRRVIGEHIRIELDLRADSGRLKADPGQIGQVLLNLCVNARDAMQAGGVIVISTRDVDHEPDDAYAAGGMPAGQYVRLTVRDTGIGIAQENLANIFEPFFTTKEKGENTGLGLATCYGIVTQSGGFIGVESTPGEGTAFTVHLPHADASGEEMAETGEMGVWPGGNETILYVEDESNVRNLTARVLRQLGYEVIEAGNGLQARHVVEELQGRPIDLLLSDVVLPDYAVSELSEWVSEHAGTTRILFTSGYADQNILRRHGFTGQGPFLQKPFTPLALARSVREVIDHPN